MFVMTVLFLGLLALLFLSLLLVKLKQEDRHGHGILLQIFDSILFFLFCSFGDYFFLFGDFDMMYFFSIALCCSLFSPFSCFLFDCRDYLLFYFSFYMITVLSVSYSRRL